MVRSIFFIIEEGMRVNISIAAKKTGLSAKMIRYYEEIGLLLNVSRTASGYRDYSENNIQNLLFIKRARGLGFSMEEIKELLMLWQDKDRASEDVKKLTEKHISELERKANDLQEMANTLRLLAQRCSGDKRSECPIIQELARVK